MNSSTLSGFFVPQFLSAWPLSVLALAALIAGVAGVVRGVTGFGAAMVMAPPLALLLEPLVAVPLVLALEAFAAAPMLPTALTRARWKLLAPILGASILFVPLGTQFVTDVNPDLLRRVIALTVLTFSLLLLSGVRWRGEHRLRTTVALGSVSGTMLGATSIGGPPVILYLLAGPDDAATTRANLTLFVAITSTAALSALAARGAIGLPSLGIAALVAPMFMLGVVAGSRLFAGLSEQRFRRGTVALMLAVSLYVLLS